MLVSLKPNAANESFDLHEARNYWRFAPSGIGKIDSGHLMTLPDSEFYAAWEQHFTSRVGHYWEEGRIIPHFAEMFRGKKVLSFGSGLGLNEMHFVRASADLTCADIVESNLRVIERVARVEGIGPVKIIAMEDSSTAEFGGPYDYIYANGSLMTIPFDKQAMVMANFKKALKLDGRIILMLYTWKFVADTCGVYSPKEFARRSDPSVGDIHNPWSDWHDDAKLMQLAGADMVISARQFWNQGYYVWFGLDWAANWSGEPAEILPLNTANSVGEVLFRPALSAFEKLEAEDLEIRDGALFVRTTSNQYLYAAWSKEEVASVTGKVGIFLDVDLQDGALSVSILDLKSDKMIMSRSVSWEGRHIHIFPIGTAEIPVPFRIVLSNCREKVPARSRFTVYDLAVVSLVE